VPPVKVLTAALDSGRKWPDVDFGASVRDMMILRNGGVLGEGGRSSRNSGPVFFGCSISGMRKARLGTSYSWFFLIVGRLQVVLKCDRGRRKVSSGAAY
jgi:hypothetical protein